MSMRQGYYKKLVKAESLFQEGCDHHQGRNGRPRDKVAALNIYMLAMRLGNAKAALHIGLLLREDPSLLRVMEEDSRDLLKFFSLAAEQGTSRAVVVPGARAPGNGRAEDGRRSPERPPRAGNGGAGYYRALVRADAYKDSAAMQRRPRSGGRKGNARLRRLASVYATGEHGQEVNRHYARELFDLLSEAAPQRSVPIRGFGRRFSHIRKWTARRA